MAHPYWFHTFITVMALFCLSLIWHELSKDRLSKRAFIVLVTAGILSWSVQFWLLDQINTESDQIANRLMLITLTALSLFWGVIALNQLHYIRARDTAQAILWGICLFPLVLVTFLPEGNHTLFVLLGL